MDELLLVALAGFCASLVDGALGMGFGPTSSSILLGAGLSPATVSGTVNVAKVATGIAAAISHWRFRNIDHRLVLQLAIPGCVGAVAGVTVLSQVDGDTLRPILAAMLILVGIRILVRFSTPVAINPEEYTDVEHDPRVRAAYPGLAHAVSEISTPPLRNMGTIGGDLANADPAEDLPAAFVALDSEVLVRGPNGERTVHIDDLYVGPYETSLDHGEILTEIDEAIRAACDDWWAPEFATRLVAALERNPAAVVAMAPPAQRPSSARHPSARGAPASGSRCRCRTRTPRS